MKPTFLISVLLFFSLPGFSQSDSNQIKHAKPLKGAATYFAIDSSKQKDIGDVLHHIFSPHKAVDETKDNKKLNIAVMPSAGYTLTTGVAADLTGNGAFYTSANHGETLSVIDADVSYDVKKQRIFVSRSEIWTNNNNYKFTSDIRWTQFPEDTYGLGTLSTPFDADPLLFDYFKAYATIYKRIIPKSNSYLGVGYNLDYHYSITETDLKNLGVTDFQTYGGQANTTSSGVNVAYLYDSRTNSINPLNGTYANVTYTQNFALLGSSSNWESLLIDCRKYLKLSRRSNNN